MIKKFLGEGERESVGPNNSITVAIDGQNESPLVEESSEHGFESVPSFKTQMEPSSPELSEISEIEPTKRMQIEHFDDDNVSGTSVEEDEPVKTLNSSQTGHEKTTREKLQMLYESSLNESEKNQ